MSATRSPTRSPTGSWRLNRLGRRFMWASMGVLAVAVVMIIIAAQQMFINDQDLGTLLWIMVPAAVAAALAAWLLSAPIARDAQRLSASARDVAAGDLTVRTGVVRNDELGDAAREFDRMTERLAAVEKERALMLSSISHDLRTPLAALRASVEAIRDGLASDPDSYLKGMERQVEALALLVDDLQLHTRLTSGTLEMRWSRIDLAEVVDEAMESMRPLAERSDVVLDLDRSSSAIVDGEPAQLARVLRNLIDNAIRHSPDGARVELSVAVRDRSAGRVRRDVLVRVRDDGSGFDEHIRASAFDAFTRGDEARDVHTGTSGLGLAIAKGVVEAHGGDIGLGDGPGGEIWFTLPLADARGD